jgi:hypothetical protein
MRTAPLGGTACARHDERVHTDRRRTPRTALTLQCTLHRRVGSAIEAETVDIGPGGMCVSCTRPLAADEVVRFDLPLPRAERVDGRARVLRQEGHNRYALRFEQLMEPALEQLRALAA